ncbi:MAG: hypothetical protein GXP02_02485 [Alphaproteobacteria bacterium]|nr:hypothetical protein [Alphaproteobacteria bacterium]
MSTRHFEVSIYNQQVRDTDKQNKEHPNFSRDWVNLHYFTYDGETEDDAVRQAHRKYPERKGFVVDRIIELKEYEFTKSPGQRF